MIGSWMKSQHLGTGEYFPKICEVSIWRILRALQIWVFLTDMSIVGAQVLGLNASVRLHLSYLELCGQKSQAWVKEKHTLQVTLMKWLELLTTTAAGAID